MSYSSSPARSPRRRRTSLVLVLSLTASVLALVAGSAAPAGAAAPETVGQPCVPGVGVTIVVDFQQLGGGIEIGCAEGEQTDGFAAITNAGITYNEDAGAYPGTMCQIRSKPTGGYPDCWFEGFWGYWKSDGTEPWAWSQVGAGHGPLAVDSIEGWSWTSPIPDDYSGTPIRLGIDDLEGLLLGDPDCAAVPQLPTFDIVSSAEILPVTLADGYPVEVAVLTDVDADPSSATWTTTASLPLADLDGEVRVLARRADTECADAPVFDAVYDVRGAYAPRWNVTDVPGAPNPAIATADPSIDGWATGYANYVPGANVTENFQTPQGALGPASSGLVVLGDRGRIDLTFDAPITNGPGYDLAVFENGFAINGPNQLDFLELGYVEVSSNGTDFVRFDTASRQPTPVGGFQGQRADLLGGTAGKDLSGRGTPFDLELLTNKPQVTNGTVDLDLITHVRIIDITGDGNDLDSFARPIYDAHPTTGSAGYDLTGVAAINTADITAPIVEITSAPEGTTTTADATIEFTVDDDTATTDYQLDDGDWQPATTPIELTDLTDGQRTITVRATDPSGNQGTDTATWTVALPVPLGAQESFVTAAYTDFLGRGPTPTELATDAARAGTTVSSRATVVRDLAASDEWIGTIVVAFYQDTLGRNPDPGGLAFWTGQLRSGRRTVAQAAAEFYASNEYYAGRGGGADGLWVTDLYERILGRAPDAAGLSHWVGQTSRRGRSFVAGQLYQSAESRRDRVRTLYDVLLGRAPDAAGLSFWTGRVLARGDLALATDLASSSEYATRATVRFPTRPAS